MSTEARKIVSQLKAAQKQLQDIVRNKDILREVRKYAEGQGQGFKRLVKSDLKKLKGFLDKEKRELKKFQKTLPAEIKKVQGYVNSQRKEAEKLIKKVRRLAKANASKRKTAKKKTRKVKRSKTAASRARTTSARKKSK